MLLKSITIIWSLVIVWLSLYPFETNRQGIAAVPNADKLVHVSMYFILSMLIAWNVRLKIPLASNTILWAIFTMLYGTIIEVFQGYMGLGRSFEFLDILANSAGVILGLTGYFILKNKLYPNLDKN